MERQEIRKLAKIIWDYHHMRQPLQKADVMLVLGSHDMRVAEYSVRIYQEGWAPIVVFSGGSAHSDDLLATQWGRPEAEVFADIAKNAGIPMRAILVENKSKNTGENILFSRSLLHEKGIHADKIIVVQKPYMERRAYATFKQIWSGPEVTVTSPPIPFEQYATEEIPEDVLIHIMVGDLQRIDVYPKKGFQISQEIPTYVADVYEKLVAAGYTKHLIEPT